MQKLMSENKTKKYPKPKSNFFIQKSECWDCNDFFHRLVLTKYDGVLCRPCYRVRYLETRSFFYDFFEAYEIEFDTSLEEYTLTIGEMVEYMKTYFEGTKGFIFAEQYKEVIEDVKSLGRTLKSKQI